MEKEIEKLLSDALRALCFTRDYVGEDKLPAIKGWDWYDAGMAITKVIPDDKWTKDFIMRCTPCPKCGRANPRHEKGCENSSMFQDDVKESCSPA